MPVRLALSSLTLCALFFAFAPERASAQGTFPGWHNDLNRAAEIARESGKPIFLVFRCVR